MQEIGGELCRELSDDLAAVLVEVGEPAERTIDPRIPAMACSLDQLSRRP